MEIIARFIGKDSTLQTGSSYVVRLENTPDLSGAMVASMSTSLFTNEGIVRTNDRWRCPYASFDTFLANWIPLR